MSGNTYRNFAPEGTPEPKWLEFKLLERPADRKTDIYEVWNKEFGSFLGRVSWYAPWRKYSFFPTGKNLVFESDCLTDIANFLKKLMEDRKSQKPEA